MISLEVKAYPTKSQVLKIEEGFRIVQFVRNKTLAPWKTKSIEGYSKYTANNIATKLRHEFPDIVGKIHSQAAQEAAERTWKAISRFYSECKLKSHSGKLGVPKFKKNNKSIEYKQWGYKIHEDRRSITFSDGLKIGKLRISMCPELNLYGVNWFKDKRIKQVGLYRKAGNYYVRFSIDVRRQEDLPPSGKTLGLDMGLKDFYTDSQGSKVANPRFYQKAEQKLKRLNKKVSKKQKGSRNRQKARIKLQRAYLKVSNQRKDFAIKQARCVVRSNDLVVIEDLETNKMIKDKLFSKHILDATWGIFKRWLIYYGQIYGRQVKLVNPAYTSQTCSGCGIIVLKTLSERTHDCKDCGLVLDRDHNAAINILKLGLRPDVPRGTGKLKPKESKSSAIA